MKYNKALSIIRKAFIYENIIRPQFVGFCGGTCYYWFPHSAEFRDSAVIMMDLKEMGDKTYAQMVSAGAYSVMSDADRDSFFKGSATSMEWRFMNPEDVYICLRSAIHDLSTIASQALKDIEYKTLEVDDEED